MNHQLQPGQSARPEVRARNKFSADTLEVATGEQYLLSCDDQQFWTDLFKKYTPDGYDNALGRMVGLRFQGAYCFCLCGIYGQDEGTDFAIGSKLLLDVSRAGRISFFANDVPWMYWNNSGGINLDIRRIS